MMKIFVTGGLGYIGSHTVVELINKKYEVVIIDNLSNSKISVLDEIEKISGVRPLFYEGDILDLAFLNKIFCENKLLYLLQRKWKLLLQTLMDIQRYAMRGYCLIQPTLILKCA